MQPTIPNDHTLNAVIAQISALAPEQRAEVQDFIEFLLAKKQHHSDVEAGMAVSEAVCARYWDNEDDAEYDKL